MNSYENAPIIGSTFLSSLFLYYNAGPIPFIYKYLDSSLLTLTQDYSGATISNLYHLLQNTFVSVCAYYVPSIVLPLGAGPITRGDLLLFLLIMNQLKAFERQIGSSLTFYMLALPTIFATVLTHAIYCTLTSLGNTVPSIKLGTPLVLYTPFLTHWMPALGAMLYYARHYLYCGNSPIAVLRSFCAGNAKHRVHTPKYVTLLFLLALAIIKDSTPNKYLYLVLGHTTLHVLLVAVGYVLAPVVIKYRNSYVFGPGSVLVRLVKGSLRILFGPYHTVCHNINKFYQQQKQEQLLYAQGLSIAEDL